VIAPLHPSDALPKVRGLVKYCEEFGTTLGRIETIAKMQNGDYKKLDLTK